MAKRSRASRSDRSSHPPLWLVEGLDIVDRRRGMLLAVVGGIVVVGAVLAMVLPGVVPPTATVGAAIGLAALLLGVAAAVAADATDLIVRGPRHVAAAGGELVAVLPREPEVVSAGPLAEAIVEVREPGTPLLLGLAAAGRDARRSAIWTDTIARALVGSGVSVLRVDLASGRSEGPGLLEVVREDERLARVVELEPGVRLARLAAGRDHTEAMSALTELPAKLPQDLDILLVALPSATSRGVVAAAGALDHVLVVAERDRTSRVDLIAGLDALEAAGTQAQVVLLDTVTAMRLAPSVEVDEDEPGERRRGLASTVGRAPVVAAGADAAGADAAGREDTDADVDAAPATGADGAGPEAADAPFDDADAPDSNEDDPADAGDDDLPVMGAVAGGSAAAAVTAALGAVPPSVADDDADRATEPEPGPAPGSGDDEDTERASEPDEADGRAESQPDDDEGPADDDEGADADDADDDEGPADDADDADDVDDDEGPADDDLAEQRDVEVLDAAAEATALALTEAEHEPLPERLEDLPDAPATSEDPNAAEGPSDPEQPSDLSPEGHDDRYEAFDGDVRDEEPPVRDQVVDLAPEEQEEAEDESADTTDRLPPVGAAAADAEDGPGHPDAAGDPGAAGDHSTPADDTDEDLLRTTAQLAILADDLALRSEPGPEPDPSHGHEGEGHT